jgi:sarcosine oxidase subunit beta
MMRDVYDVAVIGAGAEGSASAYYCAKKGAQTILIDAGDIASGTSSKCDGNSLITDKQPGYDVELNLISQRLFDELASELDYDFEWERRGSWYVMENEIEMEMAAKMAKEFAEINDIHFTMLDRKEMLEEEPNLNPNLAGALLSPDDGCVYPIGLCYALALGECKFSGEWLLHSPVTDIKKLPEGEFLVRTKSRDIIAKKVVNCAGVWAPEIGHMVGLNIPIQARQGQLIVAEQTKQIAKRKIMEFGYMASKFNDGSYERSVTPAMQEFGIAMVYEPTCSNNFLLGSSRRFCGFDTGSDIEVIRSIAQRGIRFFPPMADVKIIRTYAGLRPFTPDHMPIISNTEIDGFFIAAGHEGDGIGLAPVTGLLISEIVGGEKPTISEEPLTFSRFETETA